MLTRRVILIYLVACLVACKSGSDTKPSHGSTLPYGGQVHVIPGTIEMENYDEGKPGEAYHDATPENHGAKDYRGDTQVDIEPRPDASGGHGIGWTKAGEWLIYSVVVKKSGTYRLEMPVASQKSGGTFHIEFDGVDITGSIEVPDTKNWKKLEMIQKDGVRLKAGSYAMKVVMDTEGESTTIGDIDYIRFVKVG